MIESVPSMFEEYFEGLEQELEMLSHKGQAFHKPIDLGSTVQENSSIGEPSIMNFSTACTLSQTILTSPENKLID